MDVLKADPGNTEAILGVTASLLNLGRYDEAAKILSSVNEAAAKYIDAQLLLCDLYIRRMIPLTLQNVQHAAEAVNALAGRTEDPRYYLARGDVYRAAWQLYQSKNIPTNTALAGIKMVTRATLGAAAAESYAQYLRHAAQPANREVIVRRKFEVAPWRLL
jgi:serine/threonine-protein kinase PknG